MPWISEVWANIAANKDHVSAISAFAFGLSSVVVAWVALRLNYRNNFGWNPALVVTERGVGAYGEAKDRFINVIAYANFEVWNRRKYPIVIRAVKIQLSGKVLGVGPYAYSKNLERWTVKPHEMYKEIEPQDSPRWYHAEDNSLLSTTVQTIAPSQHRELEVTAIVKNEENLDLSRIWVLIYDPVAEKSITLFWQSKHSAAAEVLWERMKYRWRAREMPETRGYTVKPRGELTEEFP